MSGKRSRTTKDKSRDLAVQDRKGPSSTRSAKRPTALAGNDLLITSERLLQTRNRRFEITRP